MAEPEKIPEKKAIGQVAKAKFRETAQKHVAEIRKTMATAIAAAFGFVIALFWNDAIKATIEQILNALNITAQTYIYKIIVAVIVTIISAVAIVQVSRWGAKTETAAK